MVPKIIWPKLVLSFGNLMYWTQIYLVDRIIQFLNNQGCTHFGYGVKYSVFQELSGNFFLAGTTKEQSR